MQVAEKSEGCIRMMARELVMAGLALDTSLHVSRCLSLDVVGICRWLRSGRDVSHRWLES